MIEKYNILVCSDGSFMRMINVMLWSLFKNNPTKNFVIYLLYTRTTENNISQKQFNELRKLVEIKGGGY